MVKIISKRQKIFRRYLGYFFTVITLGLAYWINGSWFFQPMEYDTLLNFVKELSGDNNPFGLNSKLVPYTRFNKTWLSCFTMVTADDGQYICYYNGSQTLALYITTDAPMPELVIQLHSLRGVYPTLLSLRLNRWMLANEEMFEIKDDSDD